MRRHKESLKKIDNLIATHPTISHCQLSTAVYWNYYRNTLQTGDRDMVQALQKTITLDEFLQLPETKPASEYINGAIVQKPMPKGKHSTIQGELITTVNAVGKPQRIAWAFTELRCTFGGCSIVPDVAIFAWNRIPLDADGEIANTFNAHPDLTI